MSVAIIGVAGTVIGAGATAYSTYASQSAAKKAGSATTKGLNFGQKPKAAEYRPVDFTKEQWQAIDQNYGTLAHNNDLMTWENSLIDQDALKRAGKLIPGYKSSMALEGNAANSLLNGQLPYDDALGVVAKRGELGNAMGTPGAAAPTTLRDLGLSRLDAIKSGAGLLQGMVGIAESIDPVSRRGRPQDMFVSPIDRIKLTMEQNQLIQQSDQNKYNLEAGASPNDQAAAQLGLAQRLGAIGGTGDGGASGYASALSGLITGLGKSFGSSGGAGGYSMAADPGLSATGGTSIFGVPSYTNALGGGAASTSVPKLSYRPYNIPG